jgi:DNA-binding YbaB/EbfC family protein
MDMQQLMKQAQGMQKKMQDMQEEAAKKEYEGKTGGGLVTVVTSGTGEMRKISIDPSILKEDDKEMLEDLIVAAYNDAKSKSEEESKNNMSGAFGGMGLPGMKLPF